MEKRTSGIGVETHEGVAERISEMEENLTRIRETVADAYGEPAGSMIRKISQSIETLRSFLDTRVFVENPERNGTANGAVYYAGGRRGCGGGSGGNSGCQGGCGHHHGDAPCGGGIRNGCQND